ncbi:GTPase-activating protein SST2 Ecym_7205 [Eremothecium cymbalariae DBVPG|uniref:RGS domain-containing protein n=1 Tax=Eremothecium cymbalariae (strain CBS 270.75 / DBVPG 7215 / KCTC 17166 / NRRL Y-17582) TaxID=931890 RepID=G8JW38_ERECY|nr:hypothetical protein Ecym_7205 [Eremothecium cymbalariae DBVPG\
MIVEQSSTLHEVASKSFNRTPDNLIFTNDLKQVFSILLICLDFQEKPKESSKKLFNAFSKTFPYSFSVQNAIEKMGDLELYVDMNTTSIHMSYSIKPELAYNLLSTFMDSKLLHTPADRTRDEPKENVLLQPTPKGVAILQRYVIQIGLKKIPQILKSSFNSMQLFTFERSSVNDAIIHSEYFIQLLFIKLMGSYPNVWSPTNPNDSLPTLALLTEYTDDSFSFESDNFDYSGGVPLRLQSLASNREAKFNQDLNYAQYHDTKRESPFAHRFFTNPDSDSHVQYYVSDKGVRLAKSKVFGKLKTVVEYSFTTKAIWQWLMDCTDLMYPKEAVSVAALFLKYGLIVPILLPPSYNVSKKFTVSKQAYYTLSKAGWDIVNWNFKTTAEKSNSRPSCPNTQVPDDLKVNNGFADIDYVNCSQNMSMNQPESDSGEHQIADEKPLVDLNYVLKDPGMRYLFRTHLEKEFCVENFYVYLEIRRFSKKMTMLKTLLDTKNASQQFSVKKDKQSYNSRKVRETMDAALIKRANECLAIAYHIFSTYIAAGAPFQLNIDHELRSSITNIMIHPISLLRTSSTDSIKPELSNPGQLNLFGSDNEITKQPLSKPPYKGISPPSVFDPNDELNANSFVNSKDNGNNLMISPPLPAQGSDFVHFNNCFQIPPIPSMELISNSFKTLRDLYILFDKVGRHIYRLMKIDSIPKFLNSALYQEARSLLNLSHDNSELTYHIKRRNCSTISS